MAKILDCTGWKIDYIQFGRPGSVDELCLEVEQGSPIEVVYKTKESNHPLIKTYVIPELRIPNINPEPGTVILIDKSILPYAKQIWEKLGPVELWVVMGVDLDGNSNRYVSEDQIHRVP